MKEETVYTIKVTFADSESAVQFFRQILSLKIRDVYEFKLVAENKKIGKEDEK